jgi:hypothetical protein
MNIHINHYSEAVYHPFGRFQTLDSLRSVWNRRGEAEFQTGSNAVIFKVEIGGEKHAMKCYTKADTRRTDHRKTVAGYLNRLNSAYLTPFKWLDQEIYIFDDFGKGSWQPVTLSKWVEGASLRRWLGERCTAKDCGALREMAEQFTRLGIWLSDQPWAHGDLKPDNLIVTPQSALRLIDYDNVFIPAFAGEYSPELGTPGFQHPARDAKFYNAQLDDYSIALISCALYALAEFPEWYTEQEDDELLLFDPARAMEGRDGLLQSLRAHWLDGGQTALYRLASQLSSPSPELPELPQILKSVLESPAIVADPAATEIYRREGFYGYRMPSGERLTEAIYDDAEPFADGLALVRLGKKRYFIDREGKKRIDVTACERADSFSEGLAAVRKGGQWGYIDATGALAIAPTFDGALSFRQGTAVVKRDGLYGYIDHRGQWLTKPVYTFATPFRNGMATAEKNGVTMRLSLSDIMSECEVSPKISFK